ncbi:MULTISPECIES: small secreted hydrophilic protein [Streptomyces]|uniref:small secreted hydrophilic protein n=1 Tax=Streptomyces TaxID=1883 RepID=UPI0013DBE744|nr:small secreted hydrophilic protein [Streptomyces aureoverticillatus]QIB46226.1 small secreted hydrophilic protein [Streptomyces aureoverticillatus]
MVFSHRIAALAAVVAIPLGIAVTSYALTDSPSSPKVPPKVELDSGSPSTAPTKPQPTPSDQVISPPPVGDDSTDDTGDSGDDDDDGSTTPSPGSTGKPGSAGDDDADDGPGDDGPGDDG